MHMLLLQLQQFDNQYLMIQARDKNLTNKEITNLQALENQVKLLYLHIL